MILILFSLSVLAARNASNLESNLPESDLPSYTIASGLPTYEEALEQLKSVKQSSKIPETIDWQPKTPPTPSLGTLSVAQLFQSVSKSEGCSVSTKSWTVKPWNVNFFQSVITSWNVWSGAELSTPREGQ